MEINKTAVPASHPAQPRPRHTRRPSPSLITLDESPTVARVSVSDPHRVAVATASRPEAHAQHPTETPEPRKNAALLHNMP